MRAGLSISLSVTCLVLACVSPAPAPTPTATPPRPRPTPTATPTLTPSELIERGSQDLERALCERLYEPAAVMVDFSAADRRQAWAIVRERGYLSEDYLEGIRVCIEHYRNHGEHRKANALAEMLP